MREDGDINKHYCSTVVLDLLFNACVDSSPIVNQ